MEIKVFLISFTLLLTSSLSLCHFVRSLNAKEEWSLLFRFQGTERPTCFRDPIFKEHERHRPLGHNPVSYFFSQQAWEGQHPLHRRTQPATFLNRLCLSLFHPRIARPFDGIVVSGSRTLTSQTPFLYPRLFNFLKFRKREDIRVPPYNSRPKYQVAKKVTLTYFPSIFYMSPLIPPLRLEETHSWTKTVFRYS